MLNGIVRHDKISRNLNSHYDVFINDVGIFTSVTHLAKTVTRWIEITLSHNDESPSGLLIGISIQLVPPNLYTDRIASLSLCVGNRCLIFQIHEAPSIPDSLRRLFANSQNTFIGIDVKVTLDMLNRNYGIGGGHALYQDLGNLMADKYKRSELKHANLAEFMLILTGKFVYEPEFDDNWQWHYCTLAQDKVQFACTRAFLSWEFGSLLVEPTPKVIPSPSSSTDKEESVDPIYDKDATESSFD